MKIKNKLFLSVIFSFCVTTFSVAAVEWGGIFKNDSQVLLPINQSNSIYLWLASPLGDSGLYFSGEAMYKYNLTIDDENVFTHFFDVDLFKVYGDYAVGDNTLSLSFGRYMITDETSAVFAQNSDGLSVKFSADLVNVTGYVGYTGLLNSQNVSMLDKEGLVFAGEDSVYSLANPFIPVIATITFPSLFANQSLSLQESAFIDLGDGKSNRYYSTLLMSGPVTNSFSYSLASVFGSVDFKNLMNYSIINFNVYPTDSLLLSFGAEFASGNNGSFSAFKGITSRNIVNSVSAPETSGVLVPNVAVTYIYSNLLLSTNAKLLFGLPEDGFSTEGFEADVSIIYNVFTDLQLGLDVTAYCGISNKDENKTTATIRAAISF